MPTFDHRRIAFQPPSDMSGGGSSGKKKVLVGLGVGCGLVLVVIGILFAAGAFKAVSCCSQFQGAYNDSVEAQAFGESFATHIASGDVEKAYALTSPSFQSTMSEEAFTTAVEAHRDRIDGNRPRLHHINLEGEDAQNLDDIGKGTWRLQYQFASAADTTMLLLILGAVPQGEGEDRSFVATEVAFEERPRNLSMEAPAVEVQKIHQHLQNSQYERAYGRLGVGFQQSTSADAWKQFLNDAGPALTSSTLEVREVTYEGDQATVMTHARTADGKSTLIQWELSQLAAGQPGFGWRVIAIAPMIAETATDGPDEPVPSMPTGTNAGGAAPGTNGATNGAEAPSVEANGVEPAN